MKRETFVAWVPFYLLVVILTIGIAGGGSRAVTTLVQYKENRSLPCIIIDAGHGGEDGGATSCTGVLESKLNLEIARRLDDLLHLLGRKTKMVRTTDTAIYTTGTTLSQKKVSDLKERVKLVNTTENAILISIHQNTFSDSRFDGAQVFYGIHPDSKRFADTMQSALIQTLSPASKRTSKKADGIYLMRNVQPVGVLVECGFLSNPEEEAKLRDPAYQNKLACVIASALDSFLNT